MKKLLALMTVLICLGGYAEDPPPSTAVGEHVEGCPKDCKCYPDGTLRPGKDPGELVEWCKKDENKNKPACAPGAGIIGK